MKHNDGKKTGDDKPVISLFTNSLHNSPEVLYTGFDAVLWNCSETVGLLWVTLMMLISIREITSQISQNSDDNSQAVM